MAADTHDYFTTFYGSDSGRRVLAKMEEDIFDIVPKSEAAAVGKLMLIEFLNDLKEKAGLVNCQEKIAAEAAVAMKYEPPQEQQTELLGVN